MSKPTVTVALSALNEEANIGAFLTSLLNQKQETFVLEKILVVSDGSTDKTVDVVRSFGSSLITVFDNKERVGKSSRLNDIYEDLTSDFLVQSDADVTFSHDRVIEQLIQPLIAEEKVGMCGGHPLPIPGTTFTERAINCTVNAYDKFRTIIRGGDNVFSADGRLLAYRKTFIKQVTIPSDMIANDMFTYFCCVSKGFGYRYVASAVVNFRSPQTLRDQIRQNTRFVAAPDRMRKYFPPELVSFERDIPFLTFIQSTGREFLHHPILCGYIFFINLYCKIRAHFIEPRLTAKWDIAFTTKNLK